MDGQMDGHFNDVQTDVRLGKRQIGQMLGWTNVGSDKRWVGQMSGGTNFVSDKRRVLALGWTKVAFLALGQTNVAFQLLVRQNRVGQSDKLWVALLTVAKNSRHQLTYRPEKILRKISAVVYIFPTPRWVANKIQ